MLDFGNAAQNILTLLILFGFGYLIYSRMKGSDNKFKDLFSKAGELVEKTNLKGGDKFGK